MSTAWLIETEGQAHLYWNGAPGTFTGDASRAVRFARQEDAEVVALAQGLTHVRAVEHAWAEAITERRYGDDGTIRRTEHVFAEKP